MNKVKRYSGILWMIIGPLVVLYLFFTGIEEIRNRPVADTIIQWIVFMSVSIPIGLGFVLFGWYALQGEYDHLPNSSSELEESE